jgi:hypothetical protein
MLKRLFLEYRGKNGAPQPPTNPPAAATPRNPAPSIPSNESEVPKDPQLIRVTEPAAKGTFGKMASIDEIYNAANLRTTKNGYNALKLQEMVSSHHLEGLNADAKRASVLMALEAAGALVEDVLQDAMHRTRVLNEYEQAQHKRLKEFEAGKLREHGRIEAELERVTSQYQARMAATLEELETEKENFHEWQKLKEQTLRGIAEAASFCVPQNAAVSDSTLNVLFERVATARPRY